jgi:hypothetical protein
MQDMLKPKDDLEEIVYKSGCFLFSPKLQEAACFLIALAVCMFGLGRAACGAETDSLESQIQTIPKQSQAQGAASVSPGQSDSATKPAVVPSVPVEVPTGSASFLRSATDGPAATVVSPVSGDVSSPPSTNVQPRESVVPAPGLKDGSWSTCLASGSETFNRVFEAIAGRAAEKQTQDLLRGVVRIEWVEGSVRLLREDGALLMSGADSGLGHLVGQARHKIAEKVRVTFGELAAKLVEELSTVTAESNRITIPTDGHKSILLEVTQKQDRKFWVKELKLDQPTFEVGESANRTALVNITGVKVVLEAMNLPIDIREFVRYSSNAGDTIYSVGITNPMPKPFVALLGLGHILHIKFKEKSGGAEPIAADDSELKQIPIDSFASEQAPAVEPPSNAQTPIVSPTESTNRF